MTALPGGSARNRYHTIIDKTAEARFNSSEAGPRTRFNRRQNTHFRAYGILLDAVYLKSEKWGLRAPDSKSPEFA